MPASDFLTWSETGFQSIGEWVGDPSSEFNSYDLRGESLAVTSCLQESLFIREQEILPLSRSSVV